MNPVVGLDVSKGESEVQAFLDKGKPYGKSFSIKHDLDGLGSLLAHRIRFIKSLFLWSHEEGHILRNPAAKIREPKVGKRIPKFLTEREIEHLREACLTPMEKSLFEFMFSTGCRIGEIVSLDKNCINWSDRSAIVRGKGDKEREVYFNIRCDIWLKRYIESRTDKDPAIFVTERFPHRMSIAQMRYVIKRISSRAGINKNTSPSTKAQLCHAFIKQWSTH